MPSGRYIVKVLFIEKANGEVVVTKAEAGPLAKAQEVFAGAASDFEVTDENDVEALVDGMRGSA